jgi:predicted AAA+ superfamily ATPase
VSDKIDQWLSNSSNALLVTGARQVGKTWLIRDRLRAQKQDYIEINLIDNPEYIDIIDQCRSVQDLVIGLSAVSNHIFKKNETVVFIDEVQEYKDIVTRIKFWVDEGSYRYILSGSLLGVELRNLRSAPVGYLTEIKMYPLDFNEFLIAS